MFLQNEYEMSVYNLDEADIAGQRARFDLFVKEAHRMLDKRLPVPAYDHLLKTSHAFNILDARLALGVALLGMGGGGITKEEWRLEGSRA